MKIIYGCVFLALSRLAAGAGVSTFTDSRIQDSIDGTCDPSPMTNCYTEEEDPNLDIDYTTADVTFTSVSEEGDYCCYYYNVQHRTDRNDCIDKNPSLSHLNMDVLCDAEPTLDAFNSQCGPNLNCGSEFISFDKDVSTCTLYTLKWDVGFEKTESGNQTVYVYSVCLDWPDRAAGDCPTGTSYFMTKSGNAWDYEEGTVPSCGDGATSAPEETTSAPDETTSAPEETTAAPEDTTSPDECESRGEEFIGNPHVCGCVSGECHGPKKGPLCNSIEMIAFVLSEDLGEGDLCPDGYECCCSCENCSEHLTV